MCKDDEHAVTFCLPNTGKEWHDRGNSPILDKLYDTSDIFLIKRQKLCHFLLIEYKSKITERRYMQGLRQKKITPARKTE